MYAKNPGSVNPKTKKKVSSYPEEKGSGSGRNSCLRAKDVEAKRKYRCGICKGKEIEKKKLSPLGRSHAGSTIKFGERLPLVRRLTAKEKEQTKKRMTRSMGSGGYLKGVGKGYQGYGVLTRRV